MSSVGWPLLCHALFEQRVAVVRELFARRANPNARTPGGQTALFFAQSAEQVDALVALGARLDCVDYYGRLALNEAILQHRPFEVIERLVRLGSPLFVY